METKRKKVKYNILTTEGFTEVEGKPIKKMEKYGKFCIHEENDGYWVVDEYTSGQAVCDGTTQEYTIKKAIDLIKIYGIEQIKQQIEKSIKRYGVANE